ncbi:hypothetical protein HIMB100_00011500 [SAR116 cluster alpha proteobacterium HIMB100]|nr:hypothetical protein HIMB100_00011500 [SAR116 cluster alpha proteobacterium HIMB100]
MPTQNNVRAENSVTLEKFKSENSIRLRFNPGKAGGGLASLTNCEIMPLFFNSNPEPEAEMSEYYQEKKRTAAENAEQEKELLKALYKLVESFPNYEKPYLRKDGDVVIPLDAVLKQNRAAYNGLATVFSEFMRTDIEGQRKRYSTWVK